MAWSGCFSLGGNLDLLQKSYRTSTTAVNVLDIFEGGNPDFHKNQKKKKIYYCNEWTSIKLQGKCLLLHDKVYLKTADYIK